MIFLARFYHYLLGSLMLILAVNLLNWKLSVCLFALRQRNFSLFCLFFGITVYICRIHNQNVFELSVSIIIIIPCLILILAYRLDVFRSLLLKHHLCGYRALASPREHGSAQAWFEAQIGCHDPSHSRFHLLLKEHRHGKGILLQRFTLVELEKRLGKLL